MKKNSFIFVQVLFVYSCSFFAVPCSASHAVINHSEDMSTTVYSDDGTNQNLEDAIKQRVEYITEDCMNDPLKIIFYFSDELYGLKEEFASKYFEDNDGDTFMNDYWTGKVNSYPKHFFIKKIFDVSDKIGYVNLLCQHENSDGMRLDDVLVTLKMIYVNGEWQVDNVNNLKDVFREYIRSGKMTPIVEGKLGVKADEENVVDEYTCDSIYDAYSECTDLRKAADASNDRNEKEKLFLKAYNTLKRIMAAPIFSECFPMEDSAKGNLEYMEDKLKELGVEL